MGNVLAADPSATDSTPSAAREWLEANCQKAIIWLVLAILVYAPLATGAVRTGNFLVVQGLTMVVLVLWVVRIWAQPHFRLFWPPICWAVLAFILYAIVRCQLVDIEYVARLEMIKVIVYGALFFVIINNVNRRESAAVIGITLIVVALCLAIFALFQFATHYPMIWGHTKPESYLNRGSGTFINPNHLAGFLEMILPLAMAYALMGRFGATAKVILGYAGFVMLAGIGVSLSRGGIIACAMVLMAFFTVLLFNRDFWLRAMLLLVMMVIAAVLVGNRMESAKKRFAQAFAAGKVENDRFLYWDAALKISRKNPWWGAGPGHYDSEFAQYRPPEVQMRAQYAHNEYLNTLCDWGIVGLSIIGAVMGLLYAGVARTWAVLRRSVNELGKVRSNKSAFVLGGSLGLLAIMLHSVVEFNLHIPANALVAVTLMALLSAHWRFATERFWFNPGWLGQACLSLAAVLAIGYFGQQEFRLGREAYWLKQANVETTYSDQMLTALTNAYAAEPKNYETASVLGQLYRGRSWEGNPGYEKLAEEAMVWFGRAMALNPHDQLSPMYYGMCLDWLGRHAEATPYFEKAQSLDPNGNYVAVYMGWHYMELKDYPKAKQWFERSLSLQYNELAAAYLQTVNERIARQANPINW